MKGTKNGVLRCILIAFVLPAIEFWIFDVIRRDPARNFSLFEFSAYMWPLELGAYFLSLMVVRGFAKVRARVTGRAATRVGSYLESVTLVFLSLTLFLVALASPRAWSLQAVVKYELMWHVIFCIVSGAVVAFALEQIANRRKPVGHTLIEHGSCN